MQGNFLSEKFRPPWDNEDWDGVGAQGVSVVLVWRCGSTGVSVLLVWECGRTGSFCGWCRSVGVQGFLYFSYGEVS